MFYSDLDILKKCAYNRRGICSSCCFPETGFLLSVTLQQVPDILVEFSLYTSYKVFHLHSCNLDHQGGRCIDVCAFLSLT